MNKTLDILSDILGTNKTASFYEFVTSPNFCDCHDMYEFWFEEEKSLPELLSELLIDGSLGGGKSWFSNYYLAYRVYRLFNGGSPQAQLGLALDSEIFGFYFTVSLEMAKQSGYTHLYSIFENCKWFKDNYPINTNLKSVIEFPNNFKIKAGSDFGHQIGLNVWCFILDEANFRAGVGQGMAEEYVEVTALYTQLIDRQFSRLSNADGSLNALAILISSASYQTSFMETRKQAIKGDDNAANITAVSYLIRPEKFSSETFDVFIGAGIVEPCIVESEDQKKRLLQSSNLDGTGTEDSFFRKVPINLLKQFKTNIVLALQNHCGVPTNIAGSFMTNMKFLYDSYVDDILPIFESFELEASTADDTELIEYLVPDNIQYPERPHSLFLDLSVQRDTGALSCFRYDGKNDKNEDIHTRVFLLKIIPPKPPAQTRIAKVKRLIIDLAQFINIAAFASDQYQSTSLRQEINQELGLDDIRISIDSSDVPHIHWQRGLVEGRIRQTKDDYLEREVKECVHDWKKHRVIKSKNSSDDVFQAEVGGFFLSDTIGKEGGTVEGLYSEGPINLIGGKSMNTVLRSLGYESY